MVQAWFYDDKEGDQRLEHKTNPIEEVTLKTLSSLGVLYWNVDPAGDPTQNAKLNEIRAARAYKNHDIITISPDKLPNYEQKLVDFFREHLHEDEEIRFVLEGSGYFDVRHELDPKQRWVRIAVSAGDMLVLPVGIYHRFTLDAKNYIKAMRLFKDAPKWIALNRADPATDKLEARNVYHQLLKELNPNAGEQKQSVNGKGIILQDGAKALAHYPHARVVNGMIYVSGISSRRPDNTHVGAEKQPDGTFVLDVAAQTEAVILNIQNILRAAGADLKHIVDTTCFLTDMKHYEAFNKAYNKFFDAQTGPTRTTVAVHQLPHPNLLIEIKAVAVAPQQ